MKIMISKKAYVLEKPILFVHTMQMEIHVLRYNVFSCMDYTLIQFNTFQQSRNHIFENIKYKSDLSKFIFIFRLWDYFPIFKKKQNFFFLEVIHHRQSWQPDGKDLI